MRAREGALSTWLVASAKQGGAKGKLRAGATDFGTATRFNACRGRWRQPDEGDPWFLSSSELYQGGLRSLDLALQFTGASMQVTAVDGKMVVLSWEHIATHAAWGSMDTAAAKKHERHAPVSRIN